MCVLICAYTCICNLKLMWYYWAIKYGNMIVEDWCLFWEQVSKKTATIMDIEKCHNSTTHHFHFRYNKTISAIATLYESHILVNRNMRIKVCSEEDWLLLLRYIVPFRNGLMTWQWIRWANPWVGLTNRGL